MPALSVSFSVTDSVPAAMAPWTAEAVVNDGVSDTEVAPLATLAVTGVLNDAAPTINSAVPPALPTSPVTVAVTVKFVFPAFRVFATWFVPPVAVRASEVAAVGAVVSTVKVVVPEAVAAFPAVSGAVTETVAVPSAPLATVCVKYVVPTLLDVV